MNQTQLEELVIKLTGDGVQYQKMISSAAQQTTAAAATVMQAGKQIEQVSNSLKGFASAAVSALAGFGLATSLRGTFEAFEELEKKTIKFNSILEFNGRNVAETTAEYKKFAAAIVQHTTASKGEVFALLQQAETMGFTGEKAEQLAKFSIGLGQASDMSAHQAMSIAIALERGNVQMLRRIPALRGIHDEQQLLAKAQQLANLGLKEEEALTKTVGFQIEKLQRAFKGISIEIGGMVAEGLKPLVGIMTQAVAQFQALSPETKQWITWIAAGTLAFLALGPAISTALFLMDALGINFVINTAMQIASMAVWAAWTAVVWLAQAAMTVFSVLYGFFSTVISLNTLSIILNVAWWIISTGAIWAWSAAVLIAKGAAWLLNLVLGTLLIAQAAGAAAAGAEAGAFLAFSASAIAAKVATWLLNAALTAKNVLLAGIPALIGAVVLALGAMVTAMFAAAAAVLALVFGLTLITGGLALIGAAGVVLFMVAKGLWDIVAATLATKEAIGGAAGITTVFWEWYGIIKDIVRVAQTDMPLAWELVKAAFWLAIVQIKSAWLPLWEYVKTSGFAVGAFLGNMFSSIFVSILRVGQQSFSALWTFISTGFTVLWTLIKELSAPTLRLLPWLFVLAWTEAGQMMIRGWMTHIHFLLRSVEGVGEFVSATLKHALDPTNLAFKKPKAKDFLPDAKDVLGVHADLLRNAAGALDPRKQVELQKAALDKAKRWLAEAAAAARVELPDFLADLQPQVDLAQQRLRDALAKFKAEDSPEVVAARLEVDRLRKLIDARGDKEAKKAGETVGAGFAGGIKHGIEKLDGILSHSAHAFDKIREYNEKFIAPLAQGGDPNAGPLGQSAAFNQPPQVQVNAPAPVNQNAPSKELLVLIQIRDLIANGPRGGGARPLALGAPGGVGP